MSPYLINPTAANLKGKSAWISAGLTILVAVWSYFRFPETKGRSFEEIDILFGMSYAPLVYLLYEMHEMVCIDKTDMQVASSQRNSGEGVQVLSYYH